MRALLNVVQFVFALGLSGATAFYLGPVYVAVGILVLLTCAVLLLHNSKQDSLASEVPVNFLAVVNMLATSIIFGVIWPAIPLIFVWQRADVVVNPD